MPSVVRLAAIPVLVLFLTSPAGAQSPQGLVSDLSRDLDQVQKKIMGLANAMPEGAWAWRPGKGVRSTSEVFMHIAADNYFMPAAMGLKIPAETGINGKEYDTAAAFEKKTMSRDQVISELEKSFAVLKSSLGSFPEDKLGGQVEVFGQKMTNQGLWVGTVTHLHEHLGQLIAYARSNNITPPWSK